MRRLALPVSAVSLALLAAACGSSTHARSTTVATRATAAPPSPAEIERAAALTAAKPGFRARIRARVNLPQLGGDALLAVGRGYFDPASSSGTLEVSVGLPGLLGLGGPLATQVRLVGGEAYAEVPSDLTNELGGSTGWLQESISALALGNTLSPRDILREVARDATRAVPGQRARVTIDAATGLVRTIVISYAVRGGYRVHVRLTLTGFERQPATTPPPPAQTGNLQAALTQIGF